MALGTFGGALTLVSVTDGDASTYTIETTHEKIYKFYSQETTDLSYSPGSLVFKAYGSNKEVPLNTSEYSSEISLIGYENQVDNIWELLGRLTGRSLSESSGTSNLLTVLRIIEQKSIEFKFADLFNYSVDDEDLGNSPADIASFNSMLQIIMEENGYFIIEISNSSELLATKPIPVEFGTSEDMAKFAVTATSINMAVNNSKLTFGADGLSIKNGGITIYDDSDSEILSYDNVAQSLRIKGTGKFTGAIFAESGSFKGDVSADTLTARAGLIGGFTIRNDGLYSQNESIKLLGLDGRIEADNINLGTGAHINRYIQLGGNAFIWNPDENNNGNFIEIQYNGDNAVTLNENGILKIGQISLNGQTSEISGDSFSITPELASFSNISASGKISTAVFEQGHTQSVGGAMMFKPSYKIKEYNNNTLVLDQDFNGNIGDYVYIINDNGSSLPGLIQVTEIDGNVVTLSTNVSYGGNLISLIDIGVEKDLIIGINSANTSNSFLKPRGITVSEFNLGEDDSSTKYIDENINPKVFLGDLDTSNIDFSETGVPSKARGFGLYSENVYLTGSLTTKVNSSNNNATFAGVNTLDGTPATVFVDHSYEYQDASAIVFWAGSAGTSPREIQEAPFQVTEKGSIYASQGIFTGAIITESFIRGADLYAARIHGTGRAEGTDYGLAFYDTSEGIVFFQGSPENATEVFSIGNTGLRKGENYFVEIGDSDINFNGNNFKGDNYFTDTNQNSYIHLYQNSIIGAHIGNEDLETIDAKITFNQQGINFGVKTNSQNMSVTQNLIKMSTESVQMDNTVLFGEQLKYERVSDGYNLFVLN